LIDNVRTRRSLCAVTARATRYAARAMKAAVMSRPARSSQAEIWSGGAGGTGGDSDCAASGKEVEQSAGQYRDSVCVARGNGCGGRVGTQKQLLPQFHSMRRRKHV
jgi:hypothetical protein